jgi:RNA polymerase sigma-70 factor, ECF subfamily
MSNGALVENYPLAALPVLEESRNGRVRALLDAHFVFIWRLLRRLGVPEADIDDAVQTVFVVASDKLDRIEPSSERSFLFGVALRIQASLRRSTSRRKEVDGSPLLGLVDPSTPVDEAVARREGIEILDRIVSTMPDDLRVVFVLCEIEEMTVPDAAALQGIPVGTAASRLRRARKQFEMLAKRVYASTRNRPGVFR